MDAQTTQCPYQPVTVRSVLPAQQLGAVSGGRPARFCRPKQARLPLCVGCARRTPTHRPWHGICS